MVQDKALSLSNTSQCSKAIATRKTLFLFPIQEQLLPFTDCVTFCQQPLKQSLKTFLYHLNLLTWPWTVPAKVAATTLEQRERAWHFSAEICSLKIFLFLLSPVETLTNSSIKNKSKAEVE